MRLNRYYSTYFHQHAESVFSFVTQIDVNAHDCPPVFHDSGICPWQGISFHSIMRLLALGEYFVKRGAWDNGYILGEGLRHAAKGGAIKKAAFAAFIVTYMPLWHLCNAP